MLRVELSDDALAEPSTISGISDRTLVVRIVPTSGEIPYSMDLRHFSEGLPANERSGLGGFRGRPRLTQQLAQTVRVRNWPGSRRSAKDVLQDLRHFYRFLDTCDSHMPVECLEDLGHAHTAGFKIWRDTNGHHAGVGGQARSILAAARELFDLEPLYWPSLQKWNSRARGGDTPDTQVIKRLSRAICVELRGIKSMHSEAERLANEGSDPRELVGVGPDSPWRQPANLAHLIRKTTTPVLVHRRSFDIRFYSSLYRDVDGPEYKTPASTTFERGLISKLRWFYPSQSDTQLFLGQFLIATGWNESTALNLDIDNWCIDFPMKPRLKVLKSLKVRGSNAYQYALSGESAEFAPFQIVKYMVARTRVLRDTLRAELVELERTRISSSRYHDFEQRRAHILEALKSPWLYFDAKSFTRVGKLSWSACPTLPATIRTVAEKHDIRDKDGNILNVSASDFRKGFAEFTYGHSGYQWLLSRIALGHVDAATLHLYLANQRLRRHGSDRVRTFQDALFGELGNRTVVDPAALRILVEHGKLTEEQRTRLADSRERSRVGMGCLDPYHPPRQIAPAHSGSGPCRVQRCTLCPYGVLFPNSLNGVALRLAELFEMQRTMPVDTWLQSDLPEELQSTEIAANLFPSDKVRQLVEEYQSDFRTGARLVAELEALY